MKASVIIGSAIGALLGAAAWGLITAFTGYEVGYVAWGIGLLVGAGAKVMGGQGNNTGIFCAILAILSILGGKILAVELSATAELKDDFFTQEVYDERVIDAAEFAQVDSESQYREFMFNHGYSFAESMETVSAEELAGFTNDVVPALVEFQRRKPDFETWQSETIDEAMAELPLVDVVKENLTFIDIVFVFLGVITAFKMGAGGTKEETPPEPQEEAG